MIWKAARELEEDSQSFVIVTITSAKGSIPQNLGAKAIVTTLGLNSGTIGGGKLEAHCIMKSLEILESKQQTPPITSTLNLQKDIMMTCGGEVTLLFEHFPAKNWPIAIFGAGHVAQALSRVLSKLNCQVTVIDERPEWIGKLTGVKSICVSSCQEVVKTFNDKTFFISVMKGHCNDVPILEEIYKNFPNVHYVGVIGSEAKASAIRSDLLACGVSENFIERLRIPIGLPIGSNDPEEIAISITAQLIKERDQFLA